MTGDSEIGREFDQWSNGYTELMERIVPFYRKLMANLFDRLPRSTEVTTILDLGTGNGNVIAHAAKYFPDATYIAVDASADMLNQLKGRFSDLDLLLEHNMMQDVQMAAGSIDLVTASFSIHHLDANQKSALIRQTRRWLRPGGYLMIAELMVQEGSPAHDLLIKDWKRFVIEHSNVEEWEWLIEHHRKYDRVESEQQLVKKCKEAGFSFCQSHRHDDHWVAMLAH